MILIIGREVGQNEKRNQLKAPVALLALCKNLGGYNSCRYVESARKENEVVRVVITESNSPLNTITFQGVEGEMEMLLRACAIFAQTNYFNYNRRKDWDTKSYEIFRPLLPEPAFMWPVASIQDYAVLYLTALDLFSREDIVESTRRFWQEEDLVALAS